VESHDGHYTPWLAAFLFSLTGAHTQGYYFTALPSGFMGK
jgi:hypothetical protein